MIIIIIIINITILTSIVNIVIIINSLVREGSIDPNILYQANYVHIMID